MTSDQVLFTTTKGQFILEVNYAWSPLGAERFMQLIESKFYDDTRIFRMIPNWVAQFGVSGDPIVSDIWKNSYIADEPLLHCGNTYGTVAFAMDEIPNSRATQIFVNLADNQHKLDPRKFVPFAKVVSGMDIITQFYSDYGESLRDQTEIETKGNDFLDTNYPYLDRIISAKII